VTHHTSLSGVIYYVALVHLCMNQHMKFEVASFTNSKDMIGEKLKKRVTWPLTTPSLKLITAAQWPPTMPNYISIRWHDWSGRIPNFPLYGFLCFGLFITRTGGTNGLILTINIPYNVFSRKDVPFELPLI